MEQRGVGRDFAYRRRAELTGLTKSRPIRPLRPGNIRLGDPSGVPGLGLVVAAALIIVLLLASLSASLPVLATHGGAGQHGVTLDCRSDPVIVSDGTVVKATYLIQNRAGVTGNIPNHNVTFTLRDDWVGDVIDPLTPGDQTDTLQFHQSASPDTFTEGVDQRTYSRTFVWRKGITPLVNTTVLTGTFADGHTTSGSIQCNKQQEPATPGCPTPRATTPAFNDSGVQHCVQTVAELDGAASLQRPVVQNKWELPDMDPLTAGMQYTNSLRGGGPCPNVVDGCISALGNDTTAATGLFHHAHDDGATPRKHPGQMETRPNIDDKPGKRLIEVWATVGDPNGVADIQLVQAQVRDSTGTKKGLVTLAPRSCGDLGNPNMVTSPLHAAENTGQLPHGKIDLHACNKLSFRVYSGTFLLNNEQPDGKYTVSVEATDGVGTGPALVNRFTVLNVIAFKIDFTQINFGLLAPGSRQIRPGNTVYGDGIPTIINTGNSEACLTLHFSKMIGKLRQGSITAFDATFWTVTPPETVQFAAAVPGQFASLLRPKAPTQIDFSVRPPSPLPSDQYQGRLDLSIKKQAGLCGGP